MEKDDAEVVIGASNGCWFANAKNDFSISWQNKVFREVGASAVEFCLVGDRQRKERMNCLFSGGKFEGFSHFSIHLPDYTDSLAISGQVSLAKKIMEKHKPKMFLIHPLHVSPRYWEALIENNIPIAVENMDTNKDCGYDLKELEKLLTDFNLSFVLDVQHAFEHDQSMFYAEDLLEMAREKERLVYFHVSGETNDNNHSLVFESKNRGEIVEFLVEAFSGMENTPPLILEGEYRTAEQLGREIKYLKLQLAG